MSRFFREFRENPERNIENIERVNDDKNTQEKIFQINLEKMILMKNY